MKKFLPIIIILVVGLLTGIGLLVFPKPKPKVIHFHAGFKVFADGQQVNFAKSKYMHDKPCTLNGKPVDDKDNDEQGEKAHLHDLIGDVVHVHREHATWGDLFYNLKYPVEQKDVDAFVNGKEVTNILSTEIHPYDNLVLLIGKHGDVNQYLKQATTKAYVQKMEKLSEQCGT